MSNEPIISIPIDDSAFKRFEASFNKYQKSLEKSGALWKATGKAQDEIAGKFVKTTKSLSQTAGFAKVLTNEQRQQGALANTAERMWGSISRSSGSFARNVGEATKSLLKWSTILEGVAGLLGVGALFGINKLAGGVANERRSAQGLGMTIGQQKSFGINYGKIVDSDSYLAWVNSMELDQSKRWASSSLGVRLSGNTTNDAIGLLDSLRNVAKGAIGPNGDLGNVRQIIDNRGGSFLSDEDVRKLTGSDTEYQEIKDKFGPTAKKLNIEDATAKKWQDFNSSMQEAGEKIHKVFVEGLEPLLPTLKNLSDTLVDFVSKFGEYLKSGDLFDKMKSFKEDLSSVADGFHDLMHPFGGGGDVRNHGVNWGGGIVATSKYRFASMLHPDTFKMAADYEKKFGLPGGLGRAVMEMESGGNPNIGDSSKGAMGLMQLMAGTAGDLHVDPRNPSQNAKGGNQYLAQLYKRYNGDIGKTLAAYNEGPGALDKTLASHPGDWLDYIPQETRNYVTNGQTLVNFIVTNNTGGNASVSVHQLAQGAMP